MANDAFPIAMRNHFMVVRNAPDWHRIGARVGTRIGTRIGKIPHGKKIVTTGKMA
ncbi:hypothetical protein [Paraburkholderia acidisoli]|uniref:Uncharacterized protein n=1 Tax=Paraburkholderia acidisoli TaxID=2571748 RepID=A0A7Z2GNS7_9BURK|nr:hypothetical protein [Paraburkholderia acidisoli]QGZ64975.1 hypothetical protein FAZ98_24575 [Paraburkholderia acidisoli]